MTDQVKTHTGIFYDVGGALCSMSSSNLELVDSAYTLVHLQFNKVIFRINQVLLDMDPLQIEALIQPHQTRALGVIVDDYAMYHVAANGEPGGQCTHAKHNYLLLCQDSGAHVTQVLHYHNV